MKITKVSVTKNDRILGDSKLKGYANITLDGEIAINNIGIIDGKDGMFLSFPSRKLNNSANAARPRYRDLAFPVKQETRDYITDAVLEVFNRG